MARTQSKEGMVVPIRFPAELHASIKREADAAKRTFAAEVRRRLEASLASETEAGGDPKTGQLLADIAKLAGDIGRLYAPWHEDAYSLAALRSAVDALLKLRGPKGEPVYKPDPERLLDLFYDPSDGPEKVGRMMVAMMLSAEEKP